LPALEIVGPFRGASGYDRHTREFVRHFVRHGVTVRLRQLAGWSADLPPAMRDTWFDALESTAVDADTVLHFTMPNHAHPRGGKRNINYTMFEAAGIPRDWVRRAHDHDLVIVPTESSRAAWADSGVPPERLRIAPLGVDSDFFLQRGVPIDLTLANGRALSSYRTRFLNIAELRPRKNALGLIRCWLQATTANDDAVLILKQGVFAPRALQQFGADLDAMLRRLGRPLETAAPIVLLNAVLTDEQIRSLYATATHYISMSKGEGWDNVMMEAAVCGLQLVAPRHSAYPSYLGDEDATWIPAVEKPAIFEGRMAQEDQIFFRGLSWWEPDEDAATEIIRRIVRGEQPPARSPRERIAAEYAWPRSAKKLLDTIAEEAS
jgi:glycosyltransferase involved in cell wall biosynthesis